LLGFTTDSGWAVLEGTAGTIFVSVAIGIAVGTITVTCAPVVFAACLIGGAFLMLDSHGILSGEATTEDWISLGVDVAMLGISPVMSAVTSKAIIKGFKYITGSEIIKISSSTTSTAVYNFVKGIKKVSEECINFCRDKIVGHYLENEYKGYVGLKA